MIILPGDPEFDLTLGCNLPPNWGAVAAEHSSGFHFVARVGSGILEALGGQDLEDYLEGGEYDERLLELGDDDDSEDFEE